MKLTLYCESCSFPRIVVREVQPCLKCGGLSFQMAPKGKPTAYDRLFLKAIRATWDGPA